MEISQSSIVLAKSHLKSRNCAYVSENIALLNPYQPVNINFFRSFSSNLVLMDDENISHFENDSEAWLVVSWEKPHVAYYFNSNWTSLFGCSNSHVKSYPNNIHPMIGRPFKDLPVFGDETESVILDNFFDSFSNISSSDKNSIPCHCVLTLKTLEILSLFSLHGFPIYKKQTSQTSDPIQIRDDKSIQIDLQRASSLTGRHSLIDYSLNFISSQFTSPRSHSYFIYWVIINFIFRSRISASPLSSNFDSEFSKVETFSNNINNNLEDSEILVSENEINESSLLGVQQLQSVNGSISRSRSETTTSSSIFNYYSSSRKINKNVDESKRQVAMIAICFSKLQDVRVTQTRQSTTSTVAALFSGRSSGSKNDSKSSILSSSSKKKNSISKILRGLVSSEVDNPLPDIEISSSRSVDSVVIQIGEDANNLIDS
jgi:hypothetical protein